MIKVRTWLALILLSQANLVFACEKTVTIHASKNWLPYSYEVNGVFQGLDIEVVELILSKANLCWKYVSLPSSSRAFAELRKGNIDLVFAASANEERATFANFTRAYRTESSVLYTHTDNQLNNELSEFTSVAINRGGFYGERFAEYRSRCKHCVIDISLASQRFYLLKNKRVDFVIEDSLAGQYAIANNEFTDQIKATEYVVHNNMVHYMIAKGSLSEAKLNQLNVVIKQSKAEIAQLIEKYKRQL